MPPTRKRQNPEKRAQIVANVQRDQALRQTTYRERALALFPHVCARCGREFSGKNLRELTVHHKDSDHTNNPPDGRNWELLCLYCHDDEHQNSLGGGSTREVHSEPSLGFHPFEGLGDILKPEGGESDS